MLCFSKRKKKKKQKEINFQKKQKEINFQKNGSLLLEELIASSGGKYNPIRMFSSNEILQATNNFYWRNAICGGEFVWYKGTIENRTVLIKYYREEPCRPENFYRDIAVSSMMSSHKNVLKLLGCCLEFTRPVLVCEYPPENGALTHVVRNLGPVSAGIKPLPWNVRLKIAKEIADAVTYLHTEFPRTIIHRDLKLENIFLDENWSAKLSSFSLSIPIPEGDLGVTDMIIGTTAHIEPRYFITGFVTENVDVYRLGFVMLSLLTGKPETIFDNVHRGVSLPDYVEKVLEGILFNELIDPSMLNSADEDIPDHSRMQMEAFVELALRCVRFRPGEDVPHMIDVAKELKQIIKQT
ncbi:hypothetical protein AALP_AA5G220300 [Arabis alpina]|uniref:Protein kinase domain-containing protein n=1 Tax=Arabis alpina TaxID=50452 RepID=A0A087GYP2_ARAAL|nr:hypothetical protein AALP_AA5G220300 [Arabis alpina]